MGYYVHQIDSHFRIRAANIPAAVHALNCASNEIERVANVMQNLTLPALRQKTKSNKHREEPAHAGRRN